MWQVKWVVLSEAQGDIMDVLMLDRMLRSIPDGMTVLLMSVTPLEQRQYLTQHIADQ